MHKAVFTITTMLTLLAALSCGGGSKDKVEPKVLRFYSNEDPGMWDGKQSDHVPQIKYDEQNKRKFTVTVPFEGKEMPVHRTEAIFLYGVKGQKEMEIAASRFDQVVRTAAATFEIPPTTEDNKDMYYFVVAKCNLHDMWRVPVSAN